MKSGLSIAQQEEKPMRELCKCWAEGFEQVSGNRTVGKMSFEATGEGTNTLKVG